MNKANFITCPHCGKPLPSPWQSKTATLQATQRFDVADKEPPDSPLSAAVAFLAFSVATTLAGYAICWHAELPYVLAPLAGIFIPVLLLGLKIVLHAPPRAEPGPTEHLVRVTMTTPLPSGQKLQVDETFGVSARAIRHIAKRVATDRKPFSRRSCKKTGVCSQTDFERVAATMIKRQWAHSDPDHPRGGVQLNRHGLAVLRAIALSSLSPVEGSPPPEVTG